LVADIANRHPLSAGLPGSGQMRPDLVQYGRRRPEGVRRSRSRGAGFLMDLWIWIWRISTTDLRCQAAISGWWCAAGWGATIRPSGSSLPVSSKRTTPLQSRLHPCSGWQAMV